MSLVKSKQRIADHGEVFTPAWMVEAMLDLLKGETERIDSRFLEPACGDGIKELKELKGSGFNGTTLRRTSMFLRLAQSFSHDVARFGE